MKKLNLNGSCIQNVNADGCENLEIIETNNHIDVYKTRINEVFTILLNSLQTLISSDYDIDITSIFAMMPSLFMTRATISLDISLMDKYINHYDPTISSMMNDLMNVAVDLNGEINESTK